jgi:hypothetical protein
MKSIKMRFSDAHLTYYASGWNAYSIGEGKMNVNVDEAIAKSIERAQNHKLTFGGEEKKFILATDKTNIQLSAVEREPLTLQLMWDVKIPFEQPIYSVYGLEVTLWADTGEIYSFGVLSAAGMPSEPSWAPLPQSSSDEPVTDQSTQTNNNGDSGSESSQQTSNNESLTENGQAKASPDLTMFFVVCTVAVLVILGTIVGSNRRIGQR